MIETLFQLYYLLIICGTGMSVMRFSKLGATDKLFSSFLIGAFAFVAYWFVLMEGMQLYKVWVYPLLGVGTLLTIIHYKPLYLGLREVGQFINQYLFQYDKYRYWFIAAFLLLMVMLWMMSLTPPRAADAMLYHLAQPKQMILDHGYRFYPYLTYHLPIYFTLLAMPGFFVFSGLSFKILVFLIFIISFIILLKISQLYGIVNSRALFFLFLLVPLGFHEAHTALNDWPVICFGLLALYCFFCFKKNQKYIFILLSCVSLAFTLGVKYQAVLFVFPLFILFLIYYIQRKDLTFLCWVVGSSIVMLIAACPFYVKNWYYFKDPFWPLAVNLFSIKSNYMNNVASHFLDANSGKHSINSLFSNLKRMVLYPLVPFTLLFLAAISGFYTYKKQWELIVFTLVFFLIWWIVQPYLYLRFLIYLYPILLLIIFRGYESREIYASKWKTNLMQCFYIVTISYGALVYFYYSYFYIDYTIFQNDSAYHKYTMYYPAINWLNQHTEKNTKVLVDFISGQTYYIKSHYLRIDPGSGAINLQLFSDASEFIKKEKKLGYEYLVADIRLHPIFNDIVRQFPNKVIYHKKLKVYTSRIARSFFIADVYIFKL